MGSLKLTLSKVSPELGKSDYKVSWRFERYGAYYRIISSVPAKGIPLVRSKTIETVHMFAPSKDEDLETRIKKEQENAINGLKEKLEWIWKANTGQLDKNGSTIRFYE